MKGTNDSWGFRGTRDGAQRKRDSWTWTCGLQGEGSTRGLNGNGKIAIKVKSKKSIKGMRLGNKCPRLTLSFPLPTLQRGEGRHRKPHAGNPSSTPLQLHGLRQASLTCLCFRVLIHKMEMIHFIPNVWEFRDNSEEELGTQRAFKKCCYYYPF